MPLDFVHGRLGKNLGSWNEYFCLPWCDANDNVPMHQYSTIIIYVRTVCVTYLLASSRVQQKHSVKWILTTNRAASSHQQSEDAPLFLRLPYLLVHFFWHDKYNLLLQEEVPSLVGHTVFKSSLSVTNTHFLRNCCIALRRIFLCHFTRFIFRSSSPFVDSSQYRSLPLFYCVNNFKCNWCCFFTDLTWDRSYRGRPCNNSSHLPLQKIGAKTTIYEK